MAKINFVDTRYAGAISELKSRVAKLQNIVDGYQKIHDQADECYRSTETEKLKEAIRNNINNINQSIGATNAQIAEYERIKQNVDATNTSISNIAETAANAAKNIFLD